MKKSLIALAVAGIAAAPVAMAETIIYGAANVSYDRVDNGTSTAGVAGTSTSLVSSNASRIGFKGTEDLGGGTSAIWQIETFVNIDNSAANNIGNRNTFVGLSGESWGTVAAGRGDNPSKAVTKGLDMFIDQRGNSQLINYSAGTNAVSYSTPSMNGFNLTVGIAAAAETASLSTNTKGSDYSLGASYTAGPLYLALGYDNQKGGTTGPGTLALNQTLSYTTIAAGYTVDALTGSLTIQRTSDSTKALDRTGWMLNGKYSFGSDAIKLQYSKAGNANNANNTGANQIAIGYDHSMSKNTTLYALYSKVNNESASATYNINQGNTLTGAGADPSAWSIGMSHNF